MFKSSVAVVFFCVTSYSLCYLLTFGALSHLWERFVTQSWRGAHLFVRRFVVFARSGVECIHLDIWTSHLLIKVFVCPVHALRRRSQHIFPPHISFGLDCFPGQCSPSSNHGGSSACMWVTLWGPGSAASSRLHAIIIPMEYFFSHCPDKFFIFSLV